MIFPTQNRRGFSLLEILVTIFLISFLATLTFVNLSDYQHDTDLKNSTKEVLNNLRLAQQKAVTEQVNYSIKVNLDGSAYYLYKKSQPEQLIETYELGNQVVFSDVTGLENNEAVFNPGGAAEYSGSIFLTHQQNNKQTEIIIKPSGYVFWQYFE